MRIDEVVMFTSEISAVEVNTLRDEMTIVVPAEFELISVHPEGLNGPTHITLMRKNDSP